MRDFIKQYGFTIAFVLLCAALGWLVGGQFVSEILSRILAR